MGLDEEYHEAKNLVLQKLNIDLANRQTHNHFEMVIRVLGGLLSAYDLDPDARYLPLITKVADRLLVSFDSPSGLPPQQFYMQTGKGFGTGACMASVGTLQLEMQYVSDLTGNPIYQNKALKIYDILEKMNKGNIPGLYTDSIDTSNPPRLVKKGQYGIGGNIDSYYEYLLKMFISTKEEKFGKMYDESRDALVKHLLQTRNTSIFMPDVSNGHHDDTFQHLACFAGGMFSLGSKVRKLDEHSSKHFDIGKGITETCQRSYDESMNGLGGESFRVLENGATEINGHSIILRPEVIESVFYHYRLTKDQKYRDFGVRMVDNLNKYARTDAGYSHLYNNKKTDGMESFFLAETLKYLYLLFSDDSLISLEEYVFNTEAHPFSIRGHGRRKDPSKWVKI